MSLPLLIAIVVAVVVVVAVIVAINNRRHADGVDSFRRQIDALSPQARRNVVDQVQNAAERKRTDDDTDDDPEPGGARGS